MAVYNDKVGGSPSSPTATGLRALADLAPVGIFETDATGRVIYLNPRAVEISGWVAVGGLDALNQVFHPEDRDAVRGGWLRAVNQGTPWETEQRIVKPDGTSLWIRILSNPVPSPDGRPSGFVGTFEDITAQKAHEQALADSEEYFRHMINFLPVMVWLTDHQGHCTFLNQRWYEFTGQTIGEGLNKGWLQMVHPDDRDAIGWSFTETLGERREFRTEYRLRLRDGGYAWVIDDSVPRFGEDGQFLGYIGTVVDITDRKKGEADQQSAREAAEQTNRAKSQFLAAASHDLRQPLNAMSLLLGTLTSQITSSRGQTVLKRLRVSLDAVVALLNALLDLSKLEAGGVEAQQTGVPVSEIFSRLVGDYGPEAEAKGLELRVVPSRLVVRTDPVLIRPVLNNLIQNAVRYTQAGRILVGCRRRGPVVRIDVIDTGPGIPAREISHIFDEFYQLENPTRSRQAGHGLGLSIARRTAALLGHRLDVDSVPGRGSRFSIEVPVDTAEQPVAAGLPDEAAFEGQSCRVLLIEDDPLVSEAMEWALEDLGCTVRTASAAAEAMHLLDRFSPDLILADYRLPDDRDGLTAIRDLRERLGRPVTACLITGDLAESVRTEAERDGVPWLAKPIQVADLTRMMHQCCPRMVGQPCD